MKGERIVAAPYRWPIRVLLGTLAVISAGLIAVTLLNYHTTSKLAEQALQNTGLGMALEVAAEARALSARDAAALQALVAGQHRREIAYLAIGERDGTIIAHTNPRLVGSRSTMRHFPMCGRRTFGRGFVVLGTSKEVYELTVPFHIPPAGGPRRNSGCRTKPRFRILRIALHPPPPGKIVFSAPGPASLRGSGGSECCGGARRVAGEDVAGVFRVAAGTARQERLAALGGRRRVAHEIRNPLAPSRGWPSSWARSRRPIHAGGDHPDHRDEATRLERLVNDLLTYARPRPPKRHRGAGRGLGEDRLVAPAPRRSPACHPGSRCRDATPISPTPSRCSNSWGTSPQRHPGHAGRGRLTLTQRSVGGKAVHDGPWRYRGGHGGGNWADCAGSSSPSTPRAKGQGWGWQSAAGSPRRTGERSESRGPARRARPRGDAAEEGRRMANQSAASWSWTTGRPCASWSRPSSRTRGMR